MVEGFEAWNQLYQPPVHSGVDKPLDPNTVFLFGNVILRGVAPSGWNWFDLPRDLAGYLLQVGLPDLAGWWFTETSTFGGPPTRLPLRETIRDLWRDKPEGAELIGMPFSASAVAM